MKGVAIKDRVATGDEESAFQARLLSVLEATKRRLARFTDKRYELRVMTVRSHDVRAHTRKTYDRVYLAKKARKSKPPRMPTPAPKARRDRTASPRA